jgi:hypothetical protein
MMYRLLDMDVQAVAAENIIHRFDLTNTPSHVRVESSCCAPKVFCLVLLRALATCEDACHCTQDRHA